MSYLADISLVGHFPSRAEKRGCENSWGEVPEIGEGIAHPHGGGGGLFLHHTIRDFCGWILLKTKPCICLSNPVNHSKYENWVKTKIY
jgi:hypothetical protein